MTGDGKRASDSTTRFSACADDYARFRPRYPSAVYDYLSEFAALRADSLVVDVGAGTGLFTRPWLERGHRVCAVEPNAHMRETAAHELRDFAGLQLVDGTAEHTGLADGCATLMCAAQAFHWFDPPVTRGEFQRVLRPGGLLGIVVPGYPQSEFFVGHLTLWTPALLLYNLASAGWDCREAEYFTTTDRKHIALAVPNRPIHNMPAGKGWDVWSGLKRYLPVEFTHKMDAWLPDRWSEEAP